ncbi:MAG: BtrH N-terminal domain-containing protein [Candidatus Methanofastidiosa archaeon]|nr:BtrH N-terminal domain-containing protein [Candidatus Methanofastidiosa archaeon]
MRYILKLPHHVCKSTCFSNGLEDILAWQGEPYMEYLIPVLGGMGEFSYLKFKNATPPHMVYWGANTKYLMQELAQIIGFEQMILENHTFANTFPKIKEWINEDKPVVVGALDMYYLPYYAKIYHTQHIPIHYILLVGYDDASQTVFVQDCGCQEVQPISYDEFELSLNVNVPGMSKKNTARAFILPQLLPSELELAQKGLLFRAQKMLHPPVALFGIPAMRKLAKELFIWQDRASFEHMVIYATTPPELPSTFEKSDGMRTWKAQVLQQLGEKYGKKNWVKVSGMFWESGSLIRELCQAALMQDVKKIAENILQVADIEEEAYELLSLG